jgi:hypothetical protein
VPAPAPPAQGGAPGAPAAGRQAAAPPPPSPAAIERAGKVLEAARQALGGEKLAAVKTLVGNGRTRRVRGNNIQPIEFELSIELPDKYLRKDEFPAEESDPTSTGFNGGALLQFPAPTSPPAAARPGGPPPPTPAQLDAQRAARVTTVKQDFVRFALGIFATSFETYPLTFAWAAQAEAPQGKADVIDVRGAGNFAARLFVNAETHLPIMLSWQTPPTNVIVTVPGQPPPATVAPGAVVVSGPPAPAAGAPQAEKDQYAKDVAALRAKTQAIPVEQRIYFQDYRAQDGLQLPFKFRRAIGADTTEETTFDRYRVNARIDPKKFEPAK